MDIRHYLKAWKWQVIFFLCSWGWVSGQIQYSIAEESEPGTLVGNVAQNLGLHLTDINKRHLNVRSEGSSNLFAVNQNNGAFTVKERIDREILCGSSSSCLLHLEIVTENPFELFPLEIEILDINDNYPTFQTAHQVIRIIELLANPGTLFPLGIAQDPDAGKNSVTQYRLNPNPYFSLSIKNRKDGTLIPELVLEKNLDREEKSEHKLILTAFDGGEKSRSGSLEVTVIVLDINDNAPVFDQSNYRISVLENTPLNTVILTLNATDLDEGANGEVQYSFEQNTLDTAKTLFELNSQTGDIIIKGVLDFEEAHFYELSVRATDKGIPEMEGRCLIHIEIQDLNDNTPEILFTSKANEVPENAPLGTVVGFIGVRDKDSGRNGEIQLDISPNVPFKCQSFNNRYSLVTSGYLDREKVSQYTIQLTASDLGSPSLQHQITIVLDVSDVNDNLPVFLQSFYNAFIKENNEPGSLLCTVSATDPDEGVNSNLIYSITDNQIDGSAVSSFVYINSHNGNIYAQRSFDYEQIQVLEVTARVEDSGVPKLFSNVSIYIFILDTNDNTPSILYPEYSREDIAQEKIPRSASVGCLVTKVSAVDQDSGHNAWLMYSFLESTSNTLFQISTYTGEIRTVRDFSEADNTEQYLVVLVHDHGDPSLSSTATILVNLIDNVVQENPKSHNLFSNSKPAPDLTLYLIISLVAISLVSLVTFIILLVKCLKRGNYENSCGVCFVSDSHSKQYAGEYQPKLFLNTDGTLKYMEVRMAPAEPQGQCYQACFPVTTENNEFTFMKPQNFPQLKDMVNEDTSDANYLQEPNKQKLIVNGT
ncbi:protocadherin gamma-C5-like [Bombina bombina]|uniref:protocadherin gamma-C5-like n=1 Tax=Bombina bombina TaxID=8345 RepID=UPI00235B0334|nr:protocadherin gamma-C5-like [Bombina bombina]